MHTYLLYFLKTFFEKMKIGPCKFVQAYGRWKQKQKNNIFVAHGNKTPIKIKMFNLLSAVLSGFMIHTNRIRKAPYSSKYAVQSTSQKEWNNRGSAAVEATCIMPFMLFAFWAFYSMGQIYILENQVYQAAMNTAGYLAEYAYLAEEYGETKGMGTQIIGIGAANVKFRSYLEDTTRIEKYVVGGVHGLWITGSEILDEEGFICMQIWYQVRIPIPLLSNLSIPVSVQVRQKAYTGYQEKEKNPDEEQYVYIAEYSSVYHFSRSCSHLKLTIMPVTKTALQISHSDLLPCALCGKEPAELYYITETGECYHTSAQCSGLKRTVRRVKLSEINGYAPCSRCGEISE